MEIDDLLRLFDNIEMDVLNVIPGFERAEITQKALLANFGYVEEQQQHRDYSGG